MTPAVLEVTGVSKDYRALRPLRIERLTIAAGEPVAVIGLDAAAAEVFVNLATGSSLPDQGTVSLFGRPTSALADSADWLALVDRVGLVTGRAVLLDALTTVQNLAMPFTLDLEPVPDDLRGRVESIAREVGLHESAWRQPVGALGEAERTRIRLGRALALDPGILVLEHVSARLAARDARPLAADIRALAGRRGAAVLALTADEPFARAVASTVLALDPATGRLAARARRGWFGGRPG